MDQMQSFLDKISGIYYPGSKYPLTNIQKFTTLGLSKIADKLCIPLSINHLKTKNYIVIIATDPIFKCITNYLCKEHVFPLSESNTNDEFNNYSNKPFYIISNKNKSQNYLNISTKNIYSNSPFTNLIDIVNISISALDLNEHSQNIFDLSLNSSHIFVYYLPQFNDQLIDYLSKISKYHVNIGIYSSNDDFKHVHNEFKNQLSTKKIKFVKPLVLPSEVELVEHLLDKRGDEDFRKFYKNLFNVEPNIIADNMTDVITEINEIMEEKCRNCYNKLEKDIKSLQSPNNHRELYRKRVELGIISAIILLSLLGNMINGSKNILAKLLLALIDNMLFKMMFYIILIYLLVLCVQYTDRELFRQNEESISNYLKNSELVLKTLKKSYNFI